MNNVPHHPAAQASSPAIGPVAALPAGWGMRVARDYEEGSALAAHQLKAALREKPDLLLCAATGGSPERAYELFARSFVSSHRPPAALRILKLDEWGGLPLDDPATCEAYLQRLLVRPLKIDASRFISFPGDTSSPEEECQRIGGWLRANGPIDVCVLGLGLNGHLGFNEPADELTAGCHVARLTDESMAHPMLSVTRQKPGYGLTLGMREILASRTILLLVFGAGKAAQLEQLFTGGITTRFPGSFLALHQRVVCICDEAAAVRLPAELKQTPVR